MGYRKNAPDERFCFQSIIHVFLNHGLKKEAMLFKNRNTMKKEIETYQKAKANPKIVFWRFIMSFL